MQLVKERIATDADVAAGSLRDPACAVVADAVAAVAGTCQSDAGLDDDRNDDTATAAAAAAPLLLDVITSRVCSGYGNPWFWEKGSQRR